MLEFKLNPVTGQEEASFNAELVSIGTTVLENSNGTGYQIANIKLPNGKLTSARIYSKNVPKAMIGESVTCIATRYGDGQIDVTTGGWVSSSRPTEADLEDAFGELVFSKATKNPVA